MKTLVGGTVVSPYRMIENGTVRVEGKKIRSVGKSGEKDGEVFDLSGLYITPGFIDLHIHGGGGHEFWSEDPDEILEAGLFHARHGVTGLMPTVGVEGSIAFTPEMEKKFHAYEKALQSGAAGPEYLGIHLEGPYASPEQPMAGYKVVIPVKKEEYGKFLDHCPYIKRWTFAPEIPGALDFVDDLTSRGICASMGHSSAEFDLVCEAFERGAKQMTHLYSGMTMVHRVNGLRFPGLVEASFLLDEIYAEVIANGSHLSGDLLRMLCRIKGAGRICIVSDASSFSGSPDGPVVYHGREGFIENGVIVKKDRSGFMGSAITYDRMFYNLLYKAHIGIQDAVRMSSTSPAQAVGAGNAKGVLAAGYDADIIAFDDDVEIKFVMAGGNVLYNGL